MMQFGYLKSTFDFITRYFDDAFLLVTSDVDRVQVAIFGQRGSFVKFPLVKLLSDAAADFFDQIACNMYSTFDDFDDNFVRVFHKNRIYRNFASPLVLVVLEDPITRVCHRERAATGAGIGKWTEMMSETANCCFIMNKLKTFAKCIMANYHVRKLLHAQKLRSQPLKIANFHVR